MAKVMIVEDEFIIQYELKIILEGLGHDVVAMASTAKEAIEKTESNSPDIVLMDINLREKMDGIEAAEYINKHFDIPILFITAYSDEKRVEQAKSAHPYGYLIKPVQQRDLKIAIEMGLYTAGVNKKLKQAEERFRALVETSSD